MVLLRWKGRKGLPLGGGHTGELPEVTRVLSL